MYKSKLSDQKRNAYAVLSCVGWLLLSAGIVWYMVSGADGLGSVIVSATFLLTLLAAVFVSVGMIVSISRRIRKNHRVLTKKQFVCGFGFSVYGALTAGVCSLVSVIADLTLRCESGIFLIAQCVMCVGGWMCFTFGLPIMKSFKKTHMQ